MFDSHTEDRIQSSETKSRIDPDPSEIFIPVNQPGNSLVSYMHLHAASTSLNAERRLRLVRVRTAQMKIGPWKSPRGVLLSFAGYSRKNIQQFGIVAGLHPGWVCISGCAVLTY